MGPQKKVALINDITGFGRCAISAMSPIISAMKIQSVVIPTAILSAHMAFESYYFHDYTPHMKEYIQTYKDLDMRFDAIASGFFGSKEQVDLVIDFIKHFKTKENFVLIDPVMGDHGKIYRTYTNEMCQKMKELVKYADIITPNLTELVSLCDADYETCLHSLDDIERLCEQLSKDGPRYIIVTGIPYTNNQILNYIFDREEGPTHILVDKLGSDRCGTGDVIAAVLCGYYVKGHDIVTCVKKATAFASKCIAYCEENNVPNHYGLAFEEYLYTLGTEES